MEGKVSSRKAVIVLRFTRRSGVEENAQGTREVVRRDEMSTMWVWVTRAMYIDGLCPALQLMRRDGTHSALGGRAVAVRYSQ